MLAACTQEVTEHQLTFSRGVSPNARPGGIDGAADMDAVSQPETASVLSPASTPARQSQRGSAAWTSRGLVPESLLVLTGKSGEPLQVPIASITTGFALGLRVSCPGCRQH